MRLNRFPIIILGFALFASPGLFQLIAQDSIPADLLPLNDNTAPPHMGLYEGVPKDGGISRVDDYAQSLDRTLMWGHGSEGWERWGAVESAPWLFKPWSDWVAAMPGRRVVFSIPLVPVPTKSVAVPVPKDGETGPNPQAGSSPAPPLVFTLKEGAKGGYNSHFVVLAHSLIDYKLTNSIIRLGWEFDGGWYPWRTQSLDDAKNEAQFFHQVVTAMRAVPGSEKLEFCWNGAGVNNKYDLEDAYPGDDVVDYVGLDIYDKTWAKGIYPYPPNATPEEKLEIQKKAWLDIYNSRHGIKEWIAFAKKHNKPFMIPEWGLWRDDKNGHAGFDNPYFVQQMYNLIQDPANNVYEAAYWDDREARLFPKPGTDPQYPEARELFEKLFTLPSSVPRAPQPPPLSPIPSTASTPPAPYPPSPSEH